MQNQTIRLGIVGATGYVGMELCRLALSHPNFELSALCSRSY
ncbi:MAG TPA: N-acetyl-gamma-glutamyl-phosphate reductase, partial [Clostridiaceae bacterium]|nr:N-acetyl-gamma-glutamyl-phosphate reductase [Clostridiaceae bacterium]